MGLKPLELGQIERRGGVAPVSIIVASKSITAGMIDHERSVYVAVAVHVIINIASPHTCTSRISPTDVAVCS